MNIEYKIINPNETVIKIGDIGKQFYIILKGTVEVYKTKVYNLKLNFKEFLDIINTTKNNEDFYVLETLIVDNIDLILYYNSLYEDLEKENNDYKENKDYNQLFSVIKSNSLFARSELINNALKNSILNNNDNNKSVINKNNCQSLIGKLSLFNINKRPSILYESNDKFKNKEKNTNSNSNSNNILNNNNTFLKSNKNLSMDINNLFSRKLTNNIISINANKIYNYKTIESNIKNIENTNKILQIDNSKKEDNIVNNTTTTSNKSTVKFLFKKRASTVMKNTNCNLNDTLLDSNKIISKRRSSIISNNTRSTFNINNSLIKNQDIATFTTTKNNRKNSKDSSKSIKLDSNKNISIKKRGSSILRRKFIRKNTLNFDYNLHNNFNINIYDNLIKNISNKLELANKFNYSFNCINLNFIKNIFNANYYKSEIINNIKLANSKSNFKITELYMAFRLATGQYFGEQALEDTNDNRQKYTVKTLIDRVHLGIIDSKFYNSFIKIEKIKQQGLEIDKFINNYYFVNIKKLKFEELYSIYFKKVTYRKNCYIINTSISNKSDVNKTEYHDTYIHNNVILNSSVANSNICKSSNIEMFKDYNNIINILRSKIDFNKNTDYYYKNIIDKIKKSGKIKIENRDYSSKIKYLYFLKNNEPIEVRNSCNNILDLFNIIELLLPLVDTNKTTEYNKHKLQFSYPPVNELYKSYEKIKVYALNSSFLEEYKPSKLYISNGYIIFNLYEYLFCLENPIFDLVSINNNTELYKIKIEDFITMLINEQAYLIEDLFNYLEVTVVPFIIRIAESINTKVKLFENKEKYVNNKRYLNRKNMLSIKQLNKTSAASKLKASFKLLNKNSNFYSVDFCSKSIINNKCNNIDSTLRIIGETDDVHNINDNKILCDNYKFKYNKSLDYSKICSNINDNQYSKKNKIIINLKKKLSIKNNDKLLTYNSDSINNNNLKYKDSSNNNNNNSTNNNNNSSSSFINNKYNNNTKYKSFYINNIKSLYSKTYIINTKDKTSYNCSNKNTEDLENVNFSNSNKNNNEYSLSKSIKKVNKEFIYNNIELNNIKENNKPVINNNINNNNPAYIKYFKAIEKNKNYMNRINLLKLNRNKLSK